MKYMGPSTYHSKDTAKVNTHMKSLSLTIQNIWPMLKFFKSGSNVKVTRSKNVVKIERNTHMKYENPITFHSKDMANVKVTCHSKDMANVKVFADRQTDGQVKNYMLPIFRYGGIKKVCYLFPVISIDYRIHVAYFSSPAIDRDNGAQKN
jgi:hypothetical protein